MRALVEMFKNGMIEVRFRKIVAKKIEAMIARNLRPFSLPRISSAICTRTKSSMLSATFCAPRGTSFGLRMAMRKPSATTTDTTMRMSMRRSMPHHSGFGWCPPNSIFG